MAGAGGLPPLPRLTPDCSACAALCCVALHFDKGRKFAFDKPAGQPCRNLAPASHHCTIHQSLSGSGFDGCVQFDCAGAGQHTVQGVFDGKSWVDDPSLLPEMMEVFRVMRRLHEALQLLDLCKNLPLDKHQNALIEQLYNQFSPPGGKWTPAALSELETSRAFESFKNDLTALRSAVARRAALAALPPQA